MDLNTSPRFAISGTKLLSSTWKPGARTDEKVMQINGPEPTATLAINNPAANYRSSKIISYYILKQIIKYLKTEYKNLKQILTIKKSSSYPLGGVHHCTFSI